MSAIEIMGLHRRFRGAEVISTLNLNVEHGEFFGLLGPNGAGKSTLIKILSTMLQPHEGTIRIAGYDLQTQQEAVRKKVGVIFQDSSLDERLNAYENLYFYARLYRLPKQAVARRIDEVLDLVGLSADRRRLVSEYSGGMKRRLEIARSLLSYPEILVLDEPTVGLDPQTRKHIWGYLNELNQSLGLTIFMTTQYLAEAEICQRIAVIDHGRLIALDTPTQLKAKTMGEVVSVKVNDTNSIVVKLRSMMKEEILISDEGRIVIQCQEAARLLPGLVAICGEDILELEIQKPTLEEVFIRLTGSEIRPMAAGLLEQTRGTVRSRGLG